MCDFQKEEAIEGKWYVYKGWLIMRDPPNSNDSFPPPPKNHPPIEQRVSGPYDTKEEAEEARKQFIPQSSYYIGRAELDSEGDLILR